MRGGRVGSLAASPTLVGAVTVLVVVVAVFLAYQANQGLPFVPTYQLSARAARTPTAWCQGNEVRIGGIRVGQIKSVEPENVNDAPCPNDPTRQCTGQVAKVNMELNQDLEPLPEDSTLVVRAKSALGLKYLEIDRGNSSQGFEPGSTMPLSAARPEPVEIDQVFNMFDAPTRTAIQSNLLEFGNALAGRGVDLNEAIGQLKPLGRGPDAGDAEPGRPEHRPLQLRLLAVGHRGRGRAGRARSRASSSPTSTRPSGPSPASRGRSSRSRSRRSPAAEDTAIATLPTIRPFLANTTKLFAELRPGFHAIAPVQKDLGQLDRRGRQGPAARAGLERPARPDGAVPPQPLEQRRRAARHPAPDRLQQHPRAAAPLHHAGPVVCNYAHARSSATPPAWPSYNDGIAQQPAVHRAPAAARAEDSEIGPELRAGQRQGGQPSNFLHYNPYPNTASPGQTRECEAGNEGYRRPAGDRERPGQPGDPHRGPDPPAGPKSRRSPRRRGRSDAPTAPQAALAAAQGLRRADLPQGPPAAPDAQRPDPDRPGDHRHLPGLDEGDPLPESHFELHAVFKNAANIRKDSPVRIAGVNVGKVESVKSVCENGLTDNCASNYSEVTFTVDDNGQPIHSDAQIEIRPRIFLEGNFFLDVQPGQPERPFALRAATRSRSPRPPPRSSSTRSSPRSRRPTAPTCRSCSRATARRSTTSRRAADDATQDPEVQGLTAAAGDQQVLHLRRRPAAGTRRSSTRRSRAPRRTISPT